MGGWHPGTHRASSRGPSPGPGRHSRLCGWRGPGAAVPAAAARGRLEERIACSGAPSSGRTRARAIGHHWGRLARRGRCLGAATCTARLGQVQEGLAQQGRAVTQRAAERRRWLRRGL